MRSLKLLAASSILFLSFLTVIPVNGEVEPDSLTSGIGRFQSIICEDVDSDGREEILFGSYDGYVVSVEYYAGDYSVDWTSPKYGTRVWGLRAGQFDDDENIEIIIGDGDGNVRSVDGKTKKVELGKKYPIFMVPYDPAWRTLYSQEAQSLVDLFGTDMILRTEHFGSTAIPGLASKPSIDILVEIPSFDRAKKTIIPVLEKKGYIHLWQSDRSPGHMMFVKGYGPDGYIEGVQLYHIHMAPAGHPMWDCLLFRDYLREHKQACKKYEELKYGLAKKFRNDREAYTDGKEKFVKF